MKKVGKIAIASLMVIPAITLFACSTPKNYTLMTYSSNELLGIANGGSLDSFVEGSSFNLEATVKPNEDTKFLCWIKDNSKIYSTESKVEVILNSDTAGKYTALFEEPKISSMMYATATSLSYKTENVSSVSYEIKYAYDSSSSTFNTLSKGEFNGSVGEDLFGDNVYYLGKAGSFYKYIFNLSLEVKLNSGEILTENVAFDQNVENAKFDQASGILTLQSTTELGVEVELQMSKLSSQLFEQ